MMARYEDPKASRALDAYRGRRVLVWGASGFIGRWIATALVRAGADARLVVRSPEGAARVRAWPGLEHAELVTGDLTGRDSVETIVREVRPAITFNAAGHGVDRDERDEAGAIAVNEHAVVTLCDAVAAARDRDWSGQALVHLGSSAAYGRFDAPLTEDSPAEPISLYGRTKLAGTRAVSSRCRERDLPGITARLFMVYGAGEHDHRLFPSLVRAATVGEPIALSEGTQRLDFTWAGDVAEWLLRLGVCQAERGEVVNLATGRLSAVRTFVEIAASLLNMDRSLLRFGEAPAHAHEVRYGLVSTIRLRALTGGAPATTLVQGIRATLETEGLTV